MKPNERIYHVIIFYLNQMLDSPADAIFAVVIAGVVIVVVFCC